jgi:hypothetical protein
MEESTMIIDAHAHLGIDLIFEEVRSEAEIMAITKQNAAYKNLALSA